MEKYKKSQNHIASKIQDEVVMVDIDLGKYFTLNDVGSAIWEILNAESSLEEIVDQLMTQYDIDRETCHAETAHFLKELIKNKLVEKTNA